MSEADVFTKKINQDQLVEKIKTVLRNYACDIDDDVYESYLPLCHGCKGDFEIKPEVGKTFDPDAVQVFSMLCAGYIMCQEGFEDFLPLMLETLLVHVTVTLPIEVTNEEYDLFTYLCEEDGDLLGIKTCHLEFVDLADESRFFYKNIFTSKEWDVVLDFLVLLFQNPAKCANHKLMTIMK